MNTSSSSCSIDTCQRIARALCYCCHENICLLHLKEHYDRYLIQLEPLADEINILENRLLSMEVKSLVENSRERFKQWRDQCHRTIDQFFDEKYQEVEQIVRKKIERESDQVHLIRRNLTKLLKEQEVSQVEINELKTKIQHLEGNLDDIEQTLIQIDTQPLIIDDHLVRVTEAPKMFASPMKTVDCSQVKSSILASNEQYLLFQQHLHLYLMDADLHLVKKLPWNSGEIHDACWSTFADRFVLISENCGICFVNESTISLENAKSLQKYKFHSCTCSSTSLFLTTDEFGSTLAEYRFLPDIELIQRWKSSDLCSEDQYIHNVRYHHEKLGFVIQSSPEKIVTIELRAIGTLERLWTVEVNLGSKPYQYGYCSLNHDDWLLTDRTSSRILHITKDGKIRRTSKYTPKPCNATLFGRNTLAILTENSIHLHQLYSD